MRYDSEVSGAEYAFKQRGGKYHLAERRGRAYLCPCGWSCELEHRLGVGFGLRNRVQGDRRADACFLWDKLEAEPTRNRGPYG